MKKPNDTPADDSLEVLFPDRRLTVGGGGRTWLSAS
nr:DUF6631 family protein [Pseudomonas aeruginosa]